MDERRIEEERSRARRVLEDAHRRAEREPDQGYAEDTLWQAEREYVERMSALGATVSLRDEEPESVGPPELMLCAFVELGEKKREGRLVQVVAQPWRRILERIRANPDLLDEFASHPRRFEEFLAGCYTSEGYEDVILTPRSADLGIDIVISATLPGVGTVHFADQAKAYSPGHPVPAKDVRELASALRNPRFAKGIVTTTSTFAPGVTAEFKKDIESGELVLRDRPKLLDWLDTLADPDQRRPVWQ